MAGIGASLPRVEDARLLSGRGRFTDDLDLDGQAYAVVVRATHAHAELRGIAADAAARAPGVLGVFTAADLEADGVQPIPGLSRVPGLAYKNRDGSEMADPPYYPLARGRVRHVGDPVALVLAESREQAVDAVELVETDYAPLPAVTDPAAAVADDAPQIWPDCPQNLCFDWEGGDRETADAAFARAAHVTALEVVNNRVIVSFLEPRAAAATFDKESGRFTLYAGSQSAHRHKTMLAATLAVDPDRVRVVTGDVGGAFGGKTFLYPEYALAAWAARRLGRPVKWTATRGEGFTSDLAGRDCVMRGEMAFDGGGRILGLRATGVCNMGAYVSSLAVYVAIANLWRMMSGAYRIPALWLGFKGAFTNTAPVNAYRGVGRAEAIYLIERLMDKAAREMGLDRVELRRRNFVRPADLPYETPTGAVYADISFAEVLDAALAAADWQGFPARRAEAARRGRLSGIGLCYYIEGAGGVPQEYAKVTLNADGTITAHAGFQASGQGLETTVAQVLADRFGVGYERLRVVSGDTDAVARGHGTFASRSMRMAGSAVFQAAETVLDKAKEVAAHRLEASAADIAYESGVFRIVGTDRAVDIAEVAAAAESERVPEALRGPLAAELDYQTAGITYPNGCHICEVEVDPDTGVVRVVAHSVVDDVGRVVNPRIVHGQVQGGAAQGIGQALMEHCVYDPESGQLLSGSFMDYALPRASDLPPIACANKEIPTANNPLGVKGAGEGGATGAPAAVINAILDALAERGVRSLDMPATPRRVWDALMRARREG